MDGNPDDGGGEHQAKQAGADELHEEPVFPLVGHVVDKDEFLGQRKIHDQRNQVGDDALNDWQTEQVGRPQEENIVDDRRG
jgi:hypothetical protein